MYIPHMVQIGKDQGSSGYRTLADLLAKRTAVQKTATEASQKTYTPKGREIHDTVDISGAGKIVNLARGNDLAREIRTEKDPDKVLKLIAAGLADIKRIGRLFQETFKTMFSYFGRRF